MLINIWVKDNRTGLVHQLGTDSHDSLELIDGQVHYYNLQNSCGTFGGEYSFIEAPDMDDYVRVLPEEMYLNKAYLDERIIKAIRSRPPEEVEARKKYTEECIAKAKALREENGFIIS